MNTQDEVPEANAPKYKFEDFEQWLQSLPPDEPLPTGRLDGRGFVTACWCPLALWAGKPFFDVTNNGDALLRAFPSAVDARMMLRAHLWEENRPCVVTAAECLSVVADVRAEFQWEGEGCD